MYKRQYQRRVTRVITNDFPVYFALVTRIRQESKVIGMEGGLISSTVVPQVQAVFPDGAIQKSIRVGVQVIKILQLPFDGCISPCHV